MTDDFRVTSKPLLIKKAIKEYAIKYKIGVNNYGSISNWHLFLYMKEYKIGRLWISKWTIETNRQLLPQMYREKIK